MHLLAWQKYLSNRIGVTGNPVKPQSINNYIESVKTWLEYLASRDCIGKDIIKQISYVRTPSRLPGSVLSHAQIRKLLSKIPTDSGPGYRDRAMLELLYSSGLRASELLGIDLEDVDFAYRSIRVIGKGDRERVVPFGNTAARHLETYIRAVRSFMVKDSQEKALFVNNQGNRLQYRSFLNYFQAHVQRAGLENITPHTFRRSCTTELIRGGANIYHVKEFLGHARLDTLKPYTRLTINDLKKTHEKCHPRERDK